MNDAERDQLMDELEDVVRRIEAVVTTAMCLPFDDSADDITTTFLDSRLRHLRARRDEIEEQFPECRFWPETTGTPEEA